MKKKVLSIVLTLCLIISCITLGGLNSLAAATDNQPAAAAKNSAGSSASTGPQNKIQGSAVLHCFNWSYNSIKANLQDIKNAGYTAVQTSPVQTPKDYSPSWMGQSDQWWKLYQPVSISIADGGTWLGTKAELKSLCDTAESMGIKVIVDIVANHMGNITGNGGNSMDDISTQVDAKLRNNPDYWHINSYWANSDTNRYTMTVGSIGMPDLNTGNSYIQESFKQLLIDCINLGVDGFRFDAAKHIELPTDTQNKSDFWPTVINGSQESTSNKIFYYGEILNGCGTSISNYTQYMSVTDNQTGDSALSAARSNNASGLANSNYYKGAGAEKSVLWAESHDTYMGSSGSTSSVPDSTIVKTWAIVGSRADSTSLYFARPATRMGDASSDTTWKSPTVAEINKFKNYFDGQSEYLSSSGSIAYNERGTEGVVLVNCSSSQTAAVDVPAKKMKDGTYTDAVSGSTFTVQGGRIKGEIGSTGVAVVYNYDPDAPTASITPGTSTYNTDTLTLTLNYKNATSGQYSIDNAGYQNYTNGQKITIGENLANGTVTTVKVRAINGTVTSDDVIYTYTKNVPETTSPTSQPSSTEPSSSDVPETTSPTSQPPSTEPSSSDPVIKEKILIGDTDFDKDINVKDATLIQLYIARLGMLNEKQLIASDVDYDNDVNIRDVTYIQMYCAHFSTDANHTGEYKEIAGDYELTDPESQPKTEPKTEPNTQPKTEPPTEPKTDPPVKTVKFTDNQNWGTVKAYFFNDDGDVGPSWDNRATMDFFEKNDMGQNVYIINIPDKATSAVFSNADGSQQTVDVVLTGEEGYYTDGSKEENKFKVIPWPKN